MVTKKCAPTDDKFVEVRGANIVTIDLRRNALRLLSPTRSAITAAALTPCLDMAGKVVQYGLPTIAQLFDRMRVLTIEGYTHANPLRVISELDLSCAITEGILDQLVLHDVCISPGEVKTHAAVLCLHACRERAAHAQIHRGRRGVPVIRRSIPLLDVLGSGIRAPYLIDGRGDNGFNGNLHDGLLVLDRFYSLQFITLNRAHHKSVSPTGTRVTLVSAW